MNKYGQVCEENCGCVCVREREREEELGQCCDAERQEDWVRQ